MLCLGSYTVIRKKRGVKEFLTADGVGQTAVPGGQEHTALDIKRPESVTVPHVIQDQQRPADPRPQGTYYAYTTYIYIYILITRPDVLYAVYVEHTP